MDFDFDQIDFNRLIVNSDKNKGLNTKSSNITNINNKYDKTTTETYRIKRQYKIDPLTDNEIPKDLLFQFKYRWDPYTGKIIDEDPIGPLCFNAQTLYDYYYNNRFKGLWNPPEGQFQGYYGDLVGSGSNLEVISRGCNPEKYLFRIPIIDCYLPPGHNLSIITMGPILSDDDINKIDELVKSKGRNTKLKNIKEYYDCAILNDVNDSRFINFKENINFNDNINSNSTDKEILETFNRSNVDKLVRMRNY